MDKLYLRYRLIGMMKKYKVITKGLGSDVNRAIYLRSESGFLAGQEAEKRGFTVVKVLSPLSHKSNKISKLKKKMGEDGIVGVLDEGGKEVDSERDVWKASPAHITGAMRYLFWILLGGLAVITSVLVELYCLWLLPLCFVGIFFEFMRISSTRFVLTNERMKIRTGLFSRKFEDVELFRVKDYQLIQPLSLRFFGLSTIILFSSDRSTPLVKLYAIEDGLVVRDKIRRCVNASRQRMGVREIDI